MKSSAVGASAGAVGVEEARAVGSVVGTVAVGEVPAVMTFEVASRLVLFGKVDAGDLLVVNVSASGGAWVRSVQK